MVSPRNDRYSGRDCISLEYSLCNDLKDAGRVFNLRYKNTNFKRYFEAKSFEVLCNNMSDTVSNKQKLNGMVTHG